MHTDPLTRILWLGGPTDAGKSTVAILLAKQHGWRVYHYDRHDRRQIGLLAQTNPDYADFLNASLTDRWVHATPSTLFKRVLRAFRDRFPLVMEELVANAADGIVIAEGFGLLPSLVAPRLRSPYQALWLLPSPLFKRDSFERRGKPSFAASTPDPDRAARNLFERDQLVTALYQAQLAARPELHRLEIDGRESADQAAKRAWRLEVLSIARSTHGKFLPTRGKQTS